MPSTRPARPISRARSTKAGRCCPPATTTAVSRAGHWNARPFSVLLADIDAGRVDMVVVYKIDRLTRSLADFAKLVERLEAAQLLLRLRHPGLQHLVLHGTADAERAPVLRAVRTRGHRRAHPGQDRRLEEERALDGWAGSTRLRSASRSQPAGTRRQPGRGRDGEPAVRPLSRAWMSQRDR